MAPDTENRMGQAIGEDLPHWTAREFPTRSSMHGRTCHLEPLSVPAHAADLYQAFAADRAGSDWTYLGYGPFAEREAFDAWCGWAEAQTDPQFHAVLEHSSGRALGVASFLRMQPAIGVLEVGHIHFAPALQGTTPASEALFLMISRAFDELGYRRCEWKCDALNTPSMRAARRLGFQFEGIFRQATIYKGRNRDTAWFSLIDKDWTPLRQAFESWLAPDNFDAEGGQKRSLSELRGAPKA